jgi:hypothetical protein
MHTKAQAQKIFLTGYFEEEEKGKNNAEKRTSPMKTGLLINDR